MPQEGNEYLYKRSDYVPYNNANYNPWEVYARYEAKAIFENEVEKYNINRSLNNPDLNGMIDLVSIGSNVESILSNEGIQQAMQLLRTSGAKTGNLFLDSAGQVVNNVNEAIEGLSFQQLANKTGAYHQQVVNNLRLFDSFVDSLKILMSDYEKFCKTGFDGLILSALKQNMSEDDPTYQQLAARVTTAYNNKFVQADLNKDIRSLRTLNELLQQAVSARQGNHTLNKSKRDQLVTKAAGLINNIGGDLQEVLVSLIVSSGVSTIGELTNIITGVGGKDKIEISSDLGKQYYGKNITKIQYKTDSSVVYTTENGMSGTLQFSVKNTTPSVGGENNHSVKLADSLPMRRVLAQANLNDQELKKALMYGWTSKLKDNKAYIQAKEIITAAGAVTAIANNLQGVNGSVDAPVFLVVNGKVYDILDVLNEIKRNNFKGLNVNMRDPQGKTGRWYDTAKDPRDPEKALNRSEDIGKAFIAAKLTYSMSTNAILANLH